MKKSGLISISNNGSVLHGLSTISKNNYAALSLQLEGTALFFFTDCWQASTSSLMLQ